MKSCFNISFLFFAAWDIAINSLIVSVFPGILFKMHRAETFFFCFTMTNGNDISVGDVTAVSLLVKPDHELVGKL